MYLIITNKDDVRKTASITSADKQLSKAGRINIIDIAGNVPLVYVNDRWVPVSSVNQN